MACKSDVKGMGKAPSKTSKKIKKAYPMMASSVNMTPPSNTPGSGQPGPGA